MNGVVELGVRRIGIFRRLASSMNFLSMVRFLVTKMHGVPNLITVEMRRFLISRFKVFR